jgi:hypothetical protein
LSNPARLAIMRWLRDNDALLRRLGGQLANEL